MSNYDLTPAKWASGNSTMRFSVENGPNIRETFEISTSMTWQTFSTSQSSDSEVLHESLHLLRERTWLRACGVDGGGEE